MTSALVPVGLQNDFFAASGLRQQRDELLSACNLLTRPPRHWLVVAATTLTVVCLSGCGSTEQDRARAAADDFVTAVHDGDGDAACAVLAPATFEELEQSSGSTCAGAVIEDAVDAGPQAGSNTFGSMSQVRYANDVVFLAEFDDGWRVVAAACTPRIDGPYDCAIQGP